MGEIVRIEKSGPLAYARRLGLPALFFRHGVFGSGFRVYPFQFEISLACLLVSVARA